MKKRKFKVGDLVRLNDANFEHSRSKFIYGRIKRIDNGLIKVEREDLFRNKYKGHDQKWWHPAWWQLVEVHKYW
jgi:hypothetical protein